MNRNRILLVDDDPDLLKLLSIRLTSAGYHVESASSAEQALANIALARPRVVITDLRMPGMDGMALFQHLHNEDPTLPVILLTAHGTIPDAVQATKCGVFAYLTKPYDPKALLQLVERAAALPLPDESTQDAEDEAWREEIVTASPLMVSLLAEARLVAESDSNVFIQGESGTGKELLARAIHKAGSRVDKPFVAINCAAIPEQLLESELFGHAKGAFTGAVSTREGLFKNASGGTVFLDEIGDMPLALQAKLLRVLEDREIRPIGSSQMIPVDLRIISATHRDLEEAVAKGEFREDLFYRLNVVSLSIPSLKQRREDIPLLARHFLEQQSGKRRAESFTPEAMELLIANDWPGNVRQLLNVVEQCCVLCTTSLISPALVARALHNKVAGSDLTYANAKQQFERDYLIRLLKITGGRVSEAARLAGRNRTEFYRLLSKHVLSPSMFKGNDL
ncbi:MAG: sigma 54-interacting transcriptional regulator [Candidatus Thiodiazotropha sp.]|nr:sigma 54-interacting transcriptional regulator [Candidatus Thiodiazotropha taylori]MBT3060478.1 sigma 54-interacting transcriptional regulator [Candidatus Thiodiazotropha sp. (ex Lucina pensylvanica)]MBT3064700.1 sigma 54-interacting transcriptional regulator [Candidatus Thiodiazotropha sp. (ex Lucina pensylvanica)]PUB77258.1 MAG: two-component system response regulator GlrR [gamma proteobacterium symbiont of Ctena orbiculata]PUB79200.1 MAG: two-component system response regulator GlrR [gamm